jgi:hypothetical protein
MKRTHPTSMNLTIANLSPLRRRTWCVVSLPRARAATLPAECTFVTERGEQWRAVRGRTAGPRIVYRVRAELDGNEQVRGKLLAKQHPDAADFRLHPWVADDVAELLPTFGVGAHGNVNWGLTTSITVVDESSAHKRFRVEQHGVYGLLATFWVDLLHDDPVAAVTGRVVWSDRNDPSQARTFEQLFVRCGEAVAWDFAKRCGIADPVQHGRNWITLLNGTGPVTLGDGVGLALSGRILSFVSNALPDHASSEPSDAFNDAQRSLGDLQAAAHGTVLGVCEEWDGQWLACGHLPRVAMEDLPQAAESSFAMFRGLMQQTVGWFGDRPFGLSRTPGQTGNQSDFGATKGTFAVIANDPRHIYALQHAAHAELLRGYTHFDVDRQMLLAANHPLWVTWSGETHWHPNVSTDRLGKNPALPLPPGGWRGMDDEHRSQNGLAAYLALTDDPLLEDQLRFLLETDRASYRMRFPQFGTGATRAQGRTAGAWAQLALVADEATAQGFRELLVRRFESTEQAQQMRVAGPMKFPATGSPDARKQVYRPDGSLGPWCSFWELGLFLVGVVQAVRGARGDAWVERARAVGVTTALTMARFGCFKQGEEWFTVGDMLWSNGEPPPGGLVHPSREIVADRHIGDVLSWTFAGCVAARELLPRESPEWAKLNEFITVRSGGQEATTIEGAEWWAVAGAILQAAPADAKADVAAGAAP